MFQINCSLGSTQQQHRATMYRRTCFGLTRYRDTFIEDSTLIFNNPIWVSSQSLISKSGFDVQTTTLNWVFWHEKDENQFRGWSCVTFKNKGSFERSQAQPPLKDFVIKFASWCLKKRLHFEDPFLKYEYCPKWTQITNYFCVPVNVGFSNPGFVDVSFLYVGF